MTTETQGTAKVTQLNPNRMKLAEYQRNIWHITPEAGTPLEALDTPHFFAHCARDLKIRDRIEVDAEDGAYFAEFMVLECGFNFAKVALLWKHEFKTAEPMNIDISGYDIAWRGPIRKWSVVRKADKEVMKDGLPGKIDAINWAAQHAATMAAPTIAA